MAIIRVTTMEVQVDDLIYSFSTPDNADAFEACVATVDVAYCEATHGPISKRPAEPIGRVDTAAATPVREESA